MEVLVTGSNGFIGSFLVEKLLEKNYRVRCLVRQTSQLTWLENLPVKFFYGDITDSQSLSAAVKNVDYVYHLSGKVRAKSEREFLVVNQQGTRNVLEACRQYAPALKRFVYVSSQAAAGPSKNGIPLKETDHPEPISLYGKSKLFGEQETWRYRDFFPVTIIRPPSVFGPRDDDILSIFKIIKMGIKPQIGNREKRISLIYVFDLITALLLAAENERAKNEIFFVANGKCCSWSEFENIIAGVMNKKCVAIQIPEILLKMVAAVSEAVARILGRPALLNRDKVLEMEQPYWLIDNSKAKKLLNFEPEISLEIGILQTYQWYKKMGWL